MTHFNHSFIGWPTKAVINYYTKYFGGCRTTKAVITTTYIVGGEALDHFYLYSGPTTSQMFVEDSYWCWRIMNEWNRTQRGPHTCKTCGQPLSYILVSGWLSVRQVSYLPIVLSLQPLIFLYPYIFLYSSYILIIPYIFKGSPFFKILYNVIFQFSHIFYGS